MPVPPLFLSALFPALLLLLPPSVAGAADLVAGPLVGPAHPREVTIWVQTSAAATVALAYWEPKKPDQVFTSHPVSTSPSAHGIALLSADRVLPDTRYDYLILLDGQPVAPARRQSFRTGPLVFPGAAPPPVSFAFLSGHVANDPASDPPYQEPGAGYEVFDAILTQLPDFALWAGATHGLRSADHFGSSARFHRLSASRQDPAIAAFLATLPQLATWGPSDAGPETAGAAWPGLPAARHAFRLAWPAALPSPPDHSPPPDLCDHFRWADCDFFFLDCVSSASPFPTPARYGSAQIARLLALLQSSRATFKFIVTGAPVLSPVDAPPNLAHTPAELDGLLEGLRQATPPGVFFLSGGTPFGELTRRVRGGGYDLYDLTTGPLTARPADPASAPANYFREPGTGVFARHFHLLRVTGPADARLLEIKAFDSSGKNLWTRTLAAAELR